MKEGVELMQFTFGSLHCKQANKRIMTELNYRDLIDRNATDDVRQLVHVVLHEKYRPVRLFFKSTSPQIILDLSS